MPALEEYPLYDADELLIAEAREAGAARLRVYRPDEVMVVLGRGSQAELELDLQACGADGVPVLRRPGGGCAVVLDPGNVIVSVATPSSGFRHSRRYLDQLSSWLIEGLACAGIPGVAQAGICDLAKDDRKVAGSCLRRAKDHLYYSASLLVTADIALIERYLRHPPREPDYRRGRRHRDFVSNIGQADLTADGLAQQLRTQLLAPTLPVAD